MAPKQPELTKSSTLQPTGVLHEHEDFPDFDQINDSQSSLSKCKFEIVWKNAFFIGALHVLSLFGLIAVFKARWPTLAFFAASAVLSGLGGTAGAHRYFAHRSFKATLPLHLFLLFCQTMSMLGSAYGYARDHRQHHKYSETDADPKNAQRGMFFSHSGWLMCRKHPAAMAKRKTIDTSDLVGDFWVYGQHRHWVPLAVLVGMAFPTFVPWYFWGEDPFVAFLVCVAVRYVIVANLSWSVNSIAHRYGFRPYDKNIYPADNSITQLLTLGEGWHNYHHTFPWDYRSSELGLQKMNFTTRFIDTMAFFGQAYDLKTANPDVVKARVARTGDGSHETFHAPFIAKKAPPKMAKRPHKQEVH